MAEFLKRWHIPAAMLVLGLVLAIVGTTPQPAKSLDAARAGFSAERAMVHVRKIADQPHPTGTVANSDVRAYLVRELERLGAEVSLVDGAVPDDSLDRFARWTGNRPAAMTFTNVIGTLPGCDGALPAIALMAHHDTVPGSPGAPDDTAGVATILETARAVRARGGAQRDIVLLFTDGEELGLLGATQFVDNNPLAERIGAFINLEARGGGGRTTLFQTSVDNGELIRAYAGAVGRPGGSSLATFVYEALPNDTDLTPVLEAGYAGYNLSFIGRAGLYHSPKATPERLDRGSLQDMGDQTLALTVALGNSVHLPDRTESRTFFDAFGLFVIHYGTVVGWALLACTAFLQILCLRKNKSKSLISSLAASAIVIVVGGVLLYLVNLLSGAGAGPAIYYDRLAAIPALELQAALICAAVLVGSAPFWAGLRGTMVGLILATVLQILAPTTSFIIVWPLLMAAIVGLLAKRSAKPLRAIALVAIGGLAIGFLLQFAHQFMQGVGADVPMVAALLAALAIPTLSPVIDRVDVKSCIRLSAILLISACAIALWVRLDPVADTVPIYPSMKG